MTLVSNTHEFVYLKTTKTAGTSVEMALEPYCAPPNHVPTEHSAELISEFGVVGYRGFYKPPSNPRWKFWAPHPWIHHMHANRVRHNLGAKRFDRFTKIAAVRNPYDRLVSLFFWLRRKQEPKNQSFDEIREDFRAFAMTNKWGTDFKMVSINKKPVVDEYIRFESISDDLMRLVSKIKLDPNLLNLPHTKSQASVRKKRAVAEYYDEDIAHHVRNRMAWVFDRFDYSERFEDAGNPKMTEVEK